MGQTSSRTAEPAEEGVDSRIKLAPELAQKIANDFQNEELQSAWKNVQISILERRAARNRQLEETSAKLQGKAKQTEAWVAENEKLDASIEELRNKFSDAKVALDYDAKNLEDYVKAHQPWKKEMPCLGQRAHWIDCQKKYALDSRPCDAYVDALEKCTNEAVVNQAAPS